MSRLSKFALVLAAIALPGFADAAFLTYEHFMNLVPPCTLVNGCEKVTTSVYATVLGVPVALLGAVYYLAIFLAAAYCFQSQNGGVMRKLAWATWLGLLASAWFVSLQLFVIHALCLYCLVSAGTSTGLFITGMLYLRGQRAESAAS